MNNEKFRPNWFVHLAGLGLSAFLAYMTYQTSRDDVAHGGFPMHVAIVSTLAGLTVFVVWLYLRSGLIAYTVTDEGLEIIRPNRRQVVPWHEISEVRWNRVLNYFSVWRSGGIICFTSTDGLPRAGELLYQIHQRSGCNISPALKAAVYGTAGKSP